MLIWVLRVRIVFFPVDFSCFIPDVSSMDLHLVFMLFNIFFLKIVSSTLYHFNNVLSVFNLVTFTTVHVQVLSN